MRLFPVSAHQYAVNGNMIGGYAVLAFPARYDVSGIMTFMISYGGTVYEADFGPETETEALAIEEFNPNADWAEVRPE